MRVRILTRRDWAIRKGWVAKDWKHKLVGCMGLRQPEYTIKCESRQLTRVVATCVCALTTRPATFSQTKELNNGRLAMLAIAGMVGQELVTGAKLFNV